ncbi:hypothetical protein L5515_006153 [Caenorhabditis briggsae]|uniref:Dynein axonemal light chain 1 n=1 Tax=Caenorhabditis briggsae TaxID=6238 RepID=A0AAE9JJM2_CAEBR|nr:hypothetical protein L5515_006153 [Caenorhabditis briggsae]
MSEGEKLESERREDDEEEDKENLDDSRANSSLTNSTFLASGRIQNEKAEVTSEGVLDLTNLSLTNLERNFHVEYAKVKNLAISGNNLQKFTYMKFFPKCEILDAQDCQINKFIADFNYNLLELYLSRNQLKETNQLGRFENLKILDLSSNLIEDPVVFTLKTLEILNLSSNYLTEIPDLSKCVSLRSLNLAENKIADLTKISNLISPTSLQKLDISSNSIDDLSQFSTFSQFKKLDDVAVAENPCIVEVVESDKFEYRSYIVACCSEALTSIDHEKIQDHIQTEGEWLALQGGIKKIGPGSHVALCEQIASHFPKAENGPPTPAQKSCHKALEKRRSMAVEPSGDSSVRSEDTVNSVYSPFREWNGKIGKNLNLRRTPGSVGKNNLRMCSPPEARKNRSFTFQNSANQLESFIATPSPTQRLQESTRTTSTETVICSARTELSFTVDGRSESTPLPIIETPTKLPERQLTPSVAEVSFASDETEELKNRVRALEQKVTELSKQNETLTAINDALVDTLETFKTEQANMWKAIRSQIPTPQNMTNSLVCETEEGHHVHQVKWDMPLVKGYRIFVDGSSCGEVVGKNQSARITDLTADEPHFVQIQPIGNNGESGEISKKLHIKPPPQ